MAAFEDAGRGLTGNFFGTRRHAAIEGDKDMPSLAWGNREHWMKWGAAGLVMMAAGVSSAQAELVTYEFRGTVADITDSAGVFGSPLSGTPFTLTYLADFSKGMLNGGGGGFGSGIWLSGGSSYSPDPSWPTAQFSPLSAVLEINGHSLDFAGSSAGFLGYFRTWFDGEFGVTGSSSAQLYAYTVNPADGSMLSQIDSEIGSPDIDTFGALDSPIQLPLGGITTASTSFSYLWGAGSDRETRITGNLTPELYTVAAAIPEPGTWALFGVGLAALSIVVGTRRRGWSRSA
jgi:hypothetical protein